MVKRVKRRENVFMLFAIPKGIPQLVWQQLRCGQCMQAIAMASALYIGRESKTLERCIAGDEKKLKVHHAVVPGGIYIYGLY